MDELDYALETVDGTTFEQMSAAFLRARGYDVKESGVHGTDGGWDARISMNERRGIAHASVRNDWRTKLREDAGKVADLEVDRDTEYDVLVFVTNQRVTGQQELDLEDEIEKEYGWKLQLYHRQNLLGLIHDEKPELADQYLGVDLAFDTDHLEKLESLRDDRIDAVKNREGDAEVLEDGPAVVVHVIPNGILSNQPVQPATAIPDPWVLGDLGLTQGNVAGKAKYAIDSQPGEDQGQGYAILRNDGFYESTTTSLFHSTHTEETWVNTTHGNDGLCFDASIIIVVGDALTSIDEMGFTGTASVWITLLDAGETMISHGTNMMHQIGEHPTFGADRYTTEMTTLPIEDQSFTELIPDIEPALSEIWLQYGHPDGSGKIENGKWVGGDVRIGDFRFPG